MQHSIAQTSPLSHTAQIAARTTPRTQLGAVIGARRAGAVVVDQEHRAQQNDDDSTDAHFSLDAARRRSDDSSFIITINNSDDDDFNNDDNDDDDNACHFISVVEIENVGAPHWRPTERWTLAEPVFTSFSRRLPKLFGGVEQRAACALALSLKVACGVVSPRQRLKSLQRIDRRRWR